MSLYYCLKELNRPSEIFIYINNIADIKKKHSLMNQLEIPVLRNVFQFIRLTLTSVNIFDDI